VAPPEAIAAGDFAGITARARVAAGLAGTNAGGPQ